jgi:hypothetical protein
MPTLKTPPRLEGRILNCQWVRSLLQTITKYPLFHISPTAELPDQDASSSLVSSSLISSSFVSSSLVSSSFVSSSLVSSSCDQRDAFRAPNFCIELIIFSHHSSSCTQEGYLRTMWTWFVHWVRLIYTEFFQIEGHIKRVFPNRRPH